MLPASRVAIPAASVGQQRRTSERPASSRSQGLASANGCESCLVGAGWHGTRGARKRACGGRGGRSQLSAPAYGSVQGCLRAVRCRFKAGRLPAADSATRLFCASTAHWHLGAAARSRPMVVFLIPPALLCTGAALWGGREVWRACEAEGRALVSTEAAANVEVRPRATRPATRSASDSPRVHACRPPHQVGGSQRGCLLPPTCCSSSPSRPWGGRASRVAQLCGAHSRHSKPDRSQPETCGLTSAPS